MNIAVILAGGVGERVGSNIPKQFIEINGIPIIARTIKAFNNHNEIDSILVVCLDMWKDELLKLVDTFDFNKVKHIVEPGKSRRESSFNAIMALEDIYSDDDIVLIHDAARPNIKSSVISDNIKVAKEQGACETVIEMHDTVVFSKDGKFIHDIPSRNNFFIVQTPQSFTLSMIRDAHFNYDSKLKSGETVPEVSDDAGLLLYNNIPVSLVKGSKANIKITSSEDIEYMSSILA